MPIRSPFLATGFHSITFDRSIAASFSTMPPCTFFCGFGLVWRLTMFTLSTITWPSSILTTVPRRPLSRPAITTTSSPLRILFIAVSEHFRRQRNDLHELRGAQLTRHGSEDTGSNRLQLRGQQHGGIP